jgi:hypothetical protein
MSASGAAPADAAANGSTDAGTATTSSSDAQTPDAGTDGSAQAASTDGTSTDSGTTSATSDGGTTDATPSDAGTTAAPVDYKQIVPIPAGINSGLTAVGNADMIAAFGAPGAKTTDCSAIANTALAQLTVTASVGPFNVTGLKPAVDAVARVFAAVQSAKPDLYALLGTEGMSCVRLVRGSTTNFSNHCAPREASAGFAGMRCSNDTSDRHDCGRRSRNRRGNRGSRYDNRYCKR